MASLRWALITVVAACGSLALAAPAGAGTLDQHQTAVDSGFPVGQSVLGDVRLAQTFTAGITGALDNVDVWVGRYAAGNADADLTVEIRDVSDDHPGAVLATETIASSSVPIFGGGWVPVALSPPVPSVAGEQYAIVLTAEPCTSEFIVLCDLWAGTDANAYAGGEGLGSDAGNPWVALGLDFAFKTYVTPPPVPAVPDLVAASDSGASNSDNITNATNPAFALDDAPAGCTVDLLFDGEVVAATNGVVANAPEGTYDVTARTNCGEFGTSAESAAMSPKLVIDRTAPATAIDSGPSGQHPPAVVDLRSLPRPFTDDNTPTFAFSADESGSFACRVDGGAWTSCSSPHTTFALTQAAHTFAVRATDVAGNTDATPAAKTFSVTPKCALIAIPIPSSTICV